MENETLRATWSLLFLFEIPHVISRQPREFDLIDHLRHRLAVRLSGNLKQDRSRDDPRLATLLAKIRRYMVQRERFGDRRAGLAELLRNFLMGVQELLAELLQAVCLLERTQIPSLQILYETDLQDSPIVHVY